MKTNSIAASAGHNPKKKIVPLGSRSVTVEPLTPRQVMRLVALVNLLRSELGLALKDLAAVQDAQGLSGLVVRVVEKLIGEIDFTKPGLELTPLAATVFGELGALVALSADDVADSPLDDLALAVEAFWEVNASGPFGGKMAAMKQMAALRLKGIIGDAEMSLRGALDLMLLTFRSELTKGLRPGGMTDGGTTRSSSPSSASSDGPTPTSSMDSASSDFLPLSAPSATAPDTAPPSSGFLEEAMAVEQKLAALDASEAPDATLSAAATETIT